MKCVERTILTFFMFYISSCPLAVLEALPLSVFVYSSPPVSFLSVCVCPPVCLSHSQPPGTPKVHSNSTQHSPQQHQRVGQVAVIYIGPQSRLNFTEAVIAL